MKMPKKVKCSLDPEVIELFKIFIKISKFALKKLSACKISKEDFAIPWAFDR